MAIEVRLPKLGQTMEDGTIVNCLAKVGDKVTRGDIIFEIETDKATVEMESPGDGFVKNILVEKDQTVPVGQVIMLLGKKDEEVKTPLVKKTQSPEKTVSVEPVKTESALPIDTKAQPQTEYKLGQIVPLNRLQKLTAQRMLQSKQQIPCFYLTAKADVTELVEYRTKVNQTSKVKVAYNDFIIRAVAIGLDKFPIMTGRFEGETIKLADSINIGLAIAVPGGLVAPTIKDANKKDVIQIAGDSQALIEKAQNSKLSLEDLEGACITVSNLGAYGIDTFIPIVIPGQCSILGIGQITETLMPNTGDFVTRKLMTMTLSVDHKIANGAYAAQFLDFVRKLLEDPSSFE
ncbi:MAG: dihydrolipoamide acetyltransferase family protein [Phycisphaerales bacterium]|jgi:pyruvate dehydrogenase E2 component (dihydrolipoamide acetyltransferase)